MIKLFPLFLLTTMVEEQKQIISSYEEQLQGMEEQLATPQGAADAQLAMDYSNLQKKLDEAMTEWERLCEELSKY